VCVCVCVCVKCRYTCSVGVFLQRKWAVLSLGQQVNIRPHVFDPRQDCLAAMVVEVDFLMKKKLVFIIIISLYSFLYFPVSIIQL